MEKGKYYIRIPTQEIWDKVLNKIRNGNNYYNGFSNYKDGCCLATDDGSHDSVDWFIRAGWSEQSWQEFLGEKDYSLPLIFN